MIADCRAGKIDMIITKSISRFARNTLDCLNYVRELKDLGIGIIFEKENINILDAKGEVLLTILSSLAQDESRSSLSAKHDIFPFQFTQSSHFAQLHFLSACSCNQHLVNLFLHC